MDIGKKIQKYISANRAFIEEQDRHLPYLPRDEETLLSFRRAVNRRRATVREINSFIQRYEDYLDIIRRKYGLYELKPTSATRILTAYKNALKNMLYDIAKKYDIQKSKSYTSIDYLINFIDQKKTERKEKKRLEREERKRLLSEPVDYLIDLIIYGMPVKIGKWANKRSVRSYIPVTIKDKPRALRELNRRTIKVTYKGPLPISTGLVYKFKDLEKGRKAETVTNDMLTPEYLQLMNILYDESEEDVGNHAEGEMESILPNTSAVNVTGITRDLRVSVDIPANYNMPHQRLLKDSNSLTSIYHENIETIITSNPTSFDNLYTPISKTDYIDKYFRKSSCFLTVLIDYFKPSWDNRKKKTPLTYEYLQKIFDIPLEQKDNLAVTIEIAIEKFFKPNNISLKTFDKLGNLLPTCTYQIDKRSGLTPNTLYLLLEGNHVYAINNIDSISKKDDKTEEDRLRELALACSEYFYIKKDSDKEKIDEMVRLLHNPIDELINVYNETNHLENITKLRVYTSYPLKDLFNHLINSCNYVEPGINMKSHDSITSILTKIHDTTVEFICLDTNLNKCLKFSSEEQLMKYHDMKRLGYECYLNESFLSHYNTISREVFKRFMPQPLLGKLNNPLPDIPLYQRDTIKAYTYALSEINHTYLMKETDRFIPYTDSNLRIIPEAIYLLQRTKTSDKYTIMLANEITLISGDVLVDLYLENVDLFQHCKIIYYCRLVERVALQDNIQYINILFNNPDLSVEQKKFIMNELIGQLGKNSNKKLRTTVFSDPVQATAHAIKVNACAFPRELEFGQKELKIKRTYSVNTLDAKGEARDTSNDIINHKDISIHNTDGREVYLVIENAKRTLLSGFLPLKLQLLSRDRYLLHKRYNELLKEGSNIVAVHTDCLFYQTEKPQETIKPDGSLLKNFGEFKQYPRVDTYPSKPPNDKTRIDYVDKLSKTTPNSILLDVLANPVECNYVSFESEKDYLTSDKYIQEAYEFVKATNSHIMIRGETPGVGKTSTALCVSERLVSIDKAKILFCSFTNQRVLGLSQIIKEKNIEGDVMTACKLLSMTLNTKTNKLERRKAYLSSINDYDFIVFDEIYMLDLSFATILFNAIKKNPKLRMIATGDVYQSRVFQVNTLNNEETNQYLLQAIQSYFPNGISLTVNKRMTNPKDLEILANVKRDGDMSKSGLKKIRFYECLQRHFLDNEFIGKIISYTNKHGKAINNIFMDNYMDMHPEKDYINIYGKWYHTGQRLLNKRDRYKDEKRMYNNFEYEIVTLDPKITVKGKWKFHKATMKDILDVDNKNLIDVRLYIDRPNGFRYIYYSTIHSSQGDTYKDLPISLFGMDHKYININDKYTAMSRSNSLDNVKLCVDYEVCLEDLDRQKPYIVQQAINRCIKEDSEAKLDYDIDDYVSHDFLVRKMEKSSNSCEHCGYPYHRDDWIIVKIDPSLPYVKTNVRLICRECNN